MSTEPKLVKLLQSVGKSRVFELDDGTTIERRGGTASWRNNNPGNLKFECAGGADRTVHNRRSREEALHDARRRYDGIIGLDQWGNAVFESPEAGRAAQLELLSHRFGPRTVEQMVQGYSTADYSGQTHHAAQAAMIHRTAQAQGQDLRGKTIGEMNQDELTALADGIARFEGYRVGQTATVPSAQIQHGTMRRENSSRGLPEHLREQRLSASDAAASRPAPGHPRGAFHGAAPTAGESGPGRTTGPGIRPLQQGMHGDQVRDLQHVLNLAGTRDTRGHQLQEDGRFGRHTREALLSYQASHGLPRTGVAAHLTRQSLQREGVPLVSDAAHPDNGRFRQVLDCVHQAEAQRGIPHGRHSECAAGALLAQMRRDGLERVDRVELNRDGSSIRAVQLHPTHDEPALNRRTAPLSTAVAANQSLQETTRHLHETRRQRDVPDHALGVHARPTIVR